jgi:cytochrome P450
MFCELARYPEHAEMTYNEVKDHNVAAFAPFGTGHHSCLGRFLATNTMRMVTARLVRKFQFRYAPGETGMRVMGDLRDQFTSNPGGLTLPLDLR